MLKLSPTLSFFSKKKGTSGVAYSILIGLISVSVLGTIVSIGNNTGSVLGLAKDEMTNAAAAGDDSGGNTPPTLQAPFNDTEVAGNLYLQDLSISDNETATPGLIVSATSSNQSIVADGDIQVTSPGINGWLLEVQTAPGQLGTTTITITVSDGTDQAQGSLDLTVTAGQFVFAYGGARAFTDITNSSYTDDTGAASNNNTITYGGGLYMMAGLTSNVSTSSDGLNWTQHSLPESDFSGIAYGNGMYVVAGIGGKLYYSSDGSNWSVGSSGTTEHIQNVRYFNNTFIFVAANSIISNSSDGITWSTSQQTPTGILLYDVACSPSQCVAVGANSNLFIGSASATGWGHISAGFGAITFEGITYGNGVFVAAGQNAYVITSSNGGANWTQQTTPLTLSAGNWRRDVKFGGGYFVSGGSGADIIYSTDSINWNKISAPGSYQYQAVIYAPQ